MAFPLLLIPAAKGIAAQVVRVATPYIAKQLIKRYGAKQISRQAANRITKNPPTIKDIKNLTPKIRTAGGMKPFKPISGAGSRMPGRKIGEGVAQAGPKLNKPTTGAGRATLKKQPPSLKKTPPPMKKAPPSLKQTPKIIPKKPVTGSGKNTGVTTTEKTFQSKPGTSLLPKKPVGGSVPRGGGRTQAGPRPVGSGRSSSLRQSQQRTTPQQKPLKPGFGNIVKAGTAMGTIAQGKKALDGKPSMAMPKPRPEVQGPPPPPKKKGAFKKGPPPPAGKNLIKATMFDRGKNTGFGIKGNSFVGGPAERAVMMKYYGGTGSRAAKAALAGTQGQLKKLGMDALRKERQAAKIKDMKARQASGMDNKAKGGKIGKKPITRTVNKYSTTKYDTPQKDAQYTGEKKITFGGNKKLGKAGKTKRPMKIIPRQYKGFSKLPERIQQKMDPALAAKFGEGGSIKSGAARQVKGFGAARRPKK